MHYRKFGKTDFKVSALGFGCMRLPLLDKDDPASIDEEEAIRMIRYAIDNGVNYIDTAYPYHKEQSEIVTGKALQGGYREKVKLATKLPIWKVEEAADLDKYLNEQLEKLATDHIDFYLIHALNQNTWEKAQEVDIFSFLDRALEDGRIKYAGFSFHDNLDLFKEITDAYDWTFCQIQYNYMDEDYQAGTEGLHYAAAKGMAVVVMEPLRGGSLAQNIPADIQQIWDKADTKRTSAAWALRWVWNSPEVSVVLSGMSTMEQVVENVETADRAEPNTFSKDELALINEVKEMYREKMKVACTGCGYCMPCPQGVLIKYIFSHYNEAHMYGELEDARKVYSRMMEDEKDGSVCIDCGQCVEACPQNLPIPELLQEIHADLA
ncbi:MAG: aldo/keto reductase [Halanaerobium sp.]|nr:aldo/keto reductase [Halanaerobium sp.]